MVKAITNFTQLEAWRHAHKLVLSIYNMSQSFPSEERFGLTMQIRRSAISVTSNIAEGFSRKTRREKVQFYYIALGSLSELHSQLLLAKDLKYCKPFQCEDKIKEVIIVQKLLNGLITSIKGRELRVV